MIFHNVFRVFHVVLLVVHEVLLCITMFYYVLCLASHATIGIAARVAADRLRDRDNAAWIGDDDSAEISDGAAGIVNITANVIPC